MLKKTALPVFLVLLACAGSREQKEIENYLQTMAAYYTQKGSEALEANRFGEAVDYFRKAAQALPNSPIAANNLGAAYFRAGKPDSAVAAFQTAIRLQPAYTKAYIDLGYAFLELNEFEAARQAALEAQRREPNNASAYILAAKIAEKQNRTEEAMQLYRRAVQLAPEDVGILLDLAEAQHSRGDLDAALATFEKAAQLSPQNATIFFYIGNIHAQRCRLEEAEAAYTQALQIDPRMAGARNNRGLIRMEKGDYRTATEDFLGVLGTDSTSSAALFNLSVVLSRAGALEEALRFIEKALCADSSASVFFIHKGNLLMELGRNDEAKQAFAKAAALEPHNAMAYNNLGNILAEEDPVQAKAAYEKALDLYTGLRESRRTYAADNRTGSFSDLLGGCRDISRWSTEYAMLHANLGRAKLLTGDFEQAQRHLEKAAALQPELITPFELLAQIYQQKGDLRRRNLSLARARLNEAALLAERDSIAAALQLCRKALAFDPFNAEAYALTAVLQLRSGDSLAAQKSFKKAFQQKEISARTHKLYALALFQQKKAEAGVRLLQAVQLLPNDVELRQTYASWLETNGKPEEAAIQRARGHFALGIRYEAAGRYDAALEEYRTAAALSSHADFTAAQGIIFLKKNLPVEAEIYFRQAIEADPQNFYALLGYGLLYAAHDPEEALRYLQRAQSIRPQNPLVHQALSQVYHRLGREDEAASHLQKAEEIGLFTAE
ncbi:MAG: tetratricopeptide repeat protein [candidate division KSB1 bacterium]|nr:tetratricopeptide repeat protein [candidate division KSB1 bacterium]